MFELLAFLLSVWLLGHLIRLPGLSWRRDRITIRFRVPLRHRFPRVWSAMWAFGLLVVLPVFLLGSSCGWWGL
ncbi:hypothetical protein [Actinomadura sp. SCN-SB]|uniref:hypothetical protein n=1 Tax=Actinomadura sp. SCN-SB TaxID=3373092 RepID=UPI0037504813